MRGRVLELGIGCADGGCCKCLDSLVACGVWVRGEGDLMAKSGVECLCGAAVHLCFVLVVCAGIICSGWNRYNDCGT